MFVQSHTCLRTCFYMRAVVRILGIVLVFYYYGMKFRIIFEIFAYRCYVNEANIFSGNCVPESLAERSFSIQVSLRQCDILQLSKVFLCFLQQIQNYCILIYTHNCTHSNAPRLENLNIMFICLR